MIILSLEYLLDVNMQRAAGQDAAISEAHADNAKSYLVAMSTPYTWGGFPEIQELSEMLARPIIVYDHPVAGQFKLTSHVNSSANALPLFLLRSNVRNEKAIHFQLMIPVVAFKDLFDAVGYGPMLRAALSIVMVHPARITVSDGSGHSTEFFVFGSQGDGNCLFRAIALFKLALCKLPVGDSFWSRQLPHIEEDLVKTATNVDRLWRSTAEIRNCAWSGKSVFDDSTVGGIMRLTRLIFLHCPSVADEKSVHLDAGHGLGVVQLALTVGSNSQCTAIGVEQDSELHCFAKECDLFMLQKGGQMGKVAFRCADLADFELDGVHVVHMYEAMAGNVQGDNNKHMALVERLLQTPSVHIFTSTKLQSSLLKDYRSRSTIIKEELTHSWVVVKIDGGGPRRRGNNPGGCVFMRWSGVLEGINFREFELTTSKSPVAELVQAAYQRSAGALWSLTLNSSKDKISSKTSAEGYGQALNFFFGMFELDCHLTGLKLVTGCAVIGRRVSTMPHWLIGFATSPAQQGCAPCLESPVFLVLKNDSILSQDQFAIIRQVDLIAVGTNTEAKLLEVNDFLLAKAHFKATNIFKRPLSTRISASRQTTKLQTPKIKVATAGNEFDSPSSKTKQQPLVEKKNQKQMLAEQSSDQQLQTLTNQNTVQKAKIKSLMQTVRRANKSKLVTPPSEESGFDDHDTSSDHEPSALEKQRAALGKTSKFVTPPSDAFELADRDKTFSSDHESIAAAKRRKIESDNNHATDTKPNTNEPAGPVQNGVSTALEKRIAEQTREINHAMKQQQDKLMELIQETRDNEKLQRDNANKEERRRVEKLRYETLCTEVSGLKTHLVEQEKVSEVKTLRQTNELLAQTLKDRDKNETAARSSVLNNLKDAKELMTLFQSGPSSQTGGNGNNHESYSAGAWSTGHNGYAEHSPQWPPTGYTYPPQWPTGYAPQWPTGYAPQWPTGYPPQSSSHQPSWQQWSTGYSQQPQTAYAGQPPSHQPGPGVAIEASSSKRYSTSQSGRSRRSRSRSPSESARSRRSRSPRRAHPKHSSVSSSTVQYSRSEIEGWDIRSVQRWLHNSGVSTTDAETLTGRHGILQDGYYLLSITNAEFIAQFPSHRSRELSLRVLWSKIDAMQQAR
jgi:hypothetical protein